MTDQYWYTAFGEELAKTGTTENAFRYAGEQWDPNSHFYYLRARWMEPRTGRFISVDPYRGVVRSPVTLHRYLYANAAATRYVDATGEFGLVDAVMVGVLAGILSGHVIPRWFEVDCNLITMKRIDPHHEGDAKDYGHWWTEIYGGESYGWWPDRQVDVLETLLSVPGDLNGQKAFGGTPTRDPYHGFDAGREFHPKVDPTSGKVKTCQEAVPCMRDFARRFTGRWSWPAGPNCQTFQRDMMETCGLRDPEEN